MAFQPNTTPTPNWLYNGEMKKMNETELKVVLLITRKTLGWFDPMTGNQRKEQDYISQSQFMEFTGQSHTAIAKAIQKSVEIGWIIARDKLGNLCDTPEKRRRRKIWYQLGNMFISKISKQQSGQDEKQGKNLSNILAKSKQQNASNLSNKVDNTKETITKETITKGLATLQVANNLNPLIELFKEVNPSYEQLFKNKTQRACLQRLLFNLGREKLEQILAILPKIFGQLYAPRITTPAQLEQKLGDLMAYIKQRSQEKITIMDLSK